MGVNSQPPSDGRWQWHVWELFIIAFRSRATCVLRLDRTLDFRVDATK